MPVRRATAEAQLKFWSEMLLARRVRAGDRDACAALVRAHHADVYRFLSRLCRDAHAAEDLTQETFAAAWQGIGSFGGLASLKTWLHRIAYRKFVDWDRRPRLAQQHQVRENFGAACPSGAPGPSEAAEAQEWSRRLAAAVDRLEPAEREVIVLHYFQGLSFREIAHVLGQPAGTVKWRVSEALGRLRTMTHDPSSTEPIAPRRPRRAPGLATGATAPAAAATGGAGGA